MRNCRIWTWEDAAGLSYGAGRGNRTPTPLLARDFESRASTSSAIPAMRCGLIGNWCCPFEPAYPHTCIPRLYSPYAGRIMA